MHDAIKKRDANALQAQRHAHIKRPAFVSLDEEVKQRERDEGHADQCTCRAASSQCAARGKHLRDRETPGRSFGEELPGRWLKFAGHHGHEMRAASNSAL